MQRPLPDVVVVGGGIIGTTLALRLRQRGAAVTVLDADEIAGRTSRVAAGLINPWTEAGSTGPFLDLALQSLDLLPGLVAEVADSSGLEVQLRRCGVLQLARSPEEVADLRTRLGWAGDARWVAGEDLHSLQPRAPAAAGGVLFPSAAQVDPARLLEAVTLSARRRGVRFVNRARAELFEFTGGRVSAVRTRESSIACGAAVVAAGAWTSGLLGSAGPAFELEPVRGQILSLGAQPGEGGPPVLRGHSYAVWLPEGRLRVGTTEDLAGFDLRPSASGARRLLEIAEELAPGSAGMPFLSLEAGLRPKAADGLPVIGPVPRTEGLWVSAGHFRAGIMLCAASAAMMAAAVSGEAGALPAALLPARFTPAATQISPPR